MEESLSKTSYKGENDWKMTRHDTIAHSLFYMYLPRDMSIPPPEAAAGAVVEEVPMLNSGTPRSVMVKERNGLKVCCCCCC